MEVDNSISVSVENSKFTLIPPVLTQSSFWFTPFPNLYLPPPTVRNPAPISLSMFLCLVSHPGCRQALLHPTLPHGTCLTPSVF